MRKADWWYHVLSLPLWLTFWGCGLALASRVWIGVAIRPDEWFPVYFLLSAGFLAVVHTQRRAARLTIEAIERSKATPDELAEALRIAARKSRPSADGVPPPVPARSEV